MEITKINLRTFKTRSSARQYLNKVLKYHPEISAFDLEIRESDLGYQVLVDSKRANLDPFSKIGISFK